MDETAHRPDHRWRFVTYAVLALAAAVVVAHPTAAAFMLPPKVVEDPEPGSAEDALLRFLDAASDHDRASVATARALLHDDARQRLDGRDDRARMRQRTDDLLRTWNLPGPSFQLDYDEEREDGTLRMAVVRYSSDMPDMFTLKRADGGRGPWRILMWPQ